MKSIKKIFIKWAQVLIVKGITPQRDSISISQVFILILKIFLLKREQEYLATLKLLIRLLFQDPSLYKKVLSKLSKA